MLSVPTVLATELHVAGVHAQWANDLGDAANICAAEKEGSLPWRDVRKEEKLVPLEEGPAPQW